MMATVNTKADEVRGFGKALSISSVAHRAAPRWSDPVTRDDREWWKYLPIRTESGRLRMAKLLHLWSRAYLCPVCVLWRPTRVPGEDGQGCRDILAGMKAPQTSTPPAS